MYSTDGPLNEWAWLGVALGVIILLLLFVDWLINKLEDAADEAEAQPLPPLPPCEPRWVRTFKYQRPYDWSEEPVPFDIEADCGA